VVHVGKYYWPVRGGIETYCYHLCARLKDRVDLTVLVSNEGRRTVEETVDGVRVVRVPRWGQFASTPISPGLYRRLRRVEADVIHVHLPNPMAELAYLLARPKGKLVVTYHSDVIRQKLLFKLYRRVNERFLSRADRIIAAAPQNIDYSPVLSRFKDRAVVIPFGVEPGDFVLTPERERRVAELRRELGARVVFFVGRHVYYKGIEHLIRAMKDVDARLVIGSDGPLTAELQRLTRELALVPRVTFAGRIPDDDLPCYYHASDVFCLPSIARSEAFGIVQLEAMACGLPVVSTRLTTGVVYANLDGVSGLTVPPADPAALAHALNTLFADEPLRKRLGAQALERVQREFTHDLNARRTLEVYADLTRATPLKKVPADFARKRKADRDIRPFRRNIGEILLDRPAVAIMRHPTRLH
jgi:rhamnosyl/mannosyltransferase